MTGQSDGFTVAQAGDASLNQMFTELAEKDLLARRDLRRPRRPDRARHRLRRRAGGDHAAGAQRHQHRPGPGPHRAHRPDLPGQHLRAQHPHHDGPRGGHRLHAVRHLPLPRGARPRPGEDRRHRRHRGHRQPGHPLQRHDRGPRHDRHGHRAHRHHDRHGHGRHARRLHHAAHGAHRAARRHQRAGRPRQRAAGALPRPCRRQARRRARRGLGAAGAQHHAPPRHLAHASPSWRCWPSPLRSS